MTTAWIPGEDEVLQCIYRLGPSDAREIARELRGKPVTPSEIYRVSNRLSTLRTSNKIVRCWKKISKVREDGTTYRTTCKAYKIAEGPQ